MRLAVALLVLLPALASARALPSISVTADPCTALDAAAIGPRVALELKSTLVPDETADVAARVRLGCSDDGARLVIDLLDPVTGKHAERALERSALPQAGAVRLVALAIAELVTTSWMEAVLFPEPAVPPAAPPAPAAVRAAVVSTVQPRLEPRPQRRLRVSALAVFAGSFGLSGPLFGAGLRTGGVHLRGLGWSTDLIALHGERAAVLGDITLDLVALGARVGWVRRWTAASLHLEVGARGGAVRFAGQPAGPGADARALWLPWGGPVAQVGTTVRVSRRVFVEASVEAGWMALGARALVESAAGTATGASIEGAFVLAAAGVGLHPERR